MRTRVMNLTAAGLVLLSVALLSVSLLAATPQSTNKSKKAKEAAVPEAAAPVVATPEIPDLEFISRVREEEFSHSEVMDIMSHLPDGISRRLTGSPNMKKANEWTRDQFTKWGLANAHLEAWGTFGRGWAYQLCEVRMTAPDYMQFLALPEAWTPGTNGPVRAGVVHVVATKAADLDQYKGKLSGKIVLLGEARVPPPIDKPQFERDDDASLFKIANYEVPGAPAFNPAMRQEFRERREFQDALNKFL